MAGGRTPLSIFALSVVALAAVGVIVTAIDVVDRQTVEPASIVTPTEPVTASSSTTPPPSPPPPPPIPTVQPQPEIPSPVPVPPAPGTLAPGPGLAPAPAPQPQKTPERTAGQPPKQSQSPNSFQPSTHTAFPQETTDFLGPPGTNN